MRHPVRLILPLLGALLVLGACHKKPELSPSQVAQQDMTQFQAEIRKIIKDSVRADSLVEMTNEFQFIVTKAAAEDSGAITRMGVLARDYTSTRPQFDSLYNSVRMRRRDVILQITALRIRMAGVATEEEWQQLKSARLKLSEAELQALEF
jgi:hypothetical protein